VELIASADETIKKFDLQTLRNNSRLSPLLQFLAHAMRVPGNENLAVDEPKSYDTIREWVASLSDSDWKKAL
jgi:hypothetical protein